MSEELALEGQKVYLICIQKRDTPNGMRCILGWKYLWCSLSLILPFLNIYFILYWMSHFPAVKLLLLNVSWIYTSGVAQTAFLKIICKQLMCFLNSQCYVKRHNIFSLTKYQLSSPHSLPLIYWRWGPRSSEKLWILTALKIRWGVSFCNVVL